MHDAVLAPSASLSRWHLPLPPPASRRPITIVVTCGAASPSQPYHRRSRWWSKAIVTIRVSVVRLPGSGPSACQPAASAASGLGTSSPPLPACAPPLFRCRRRRRSDQSGLTGLCPPPPPLLSLAAARASRLRPDPPLHAAVACGGRTGPTPPQLHPRPCYTGNYSEQPPPLHTATAGTHSPPTQLPGQKS